MKSLRKMLAAFVVAGSVVAALPAMSGCYATGGAYLVEDAPPPVREEVVVARPGYVWIHGHWTHPGRSWVWRSGYYAPGQWQRRGRGHVWVDGGWRARAHVTVR